MVLCVEGTSDLPTDSVSVVEALVVGALPPVVTSTIDAGRVLLSMTTSVSLIGVAIVMATRPSVVLILAKK
jgi:hypothetical protein